MLFNSLEFLFFLPVVLSIFYLLPHKWRWLFLLAGSYFFYGSWKVEFLSLLIISSVCDFYVARAIERNSEQKKRRFYLGISLVVNLGILFFFKYANFLATEILDFTEASEYRRQIILNLLSFDLPVGISFYTFQTLGYTLDVYHNRTTSQKHLGKFALYVSYFPQLVAGPIERYSHLSPQLFKDVKLDYTNLSRAFRLVLYGFFIKMVIADNLAPLVDHVFAEPDKYSTASIGGGILGFGWQIYADFYGYSLIAIGVAKAMGVDLMDNFKTPYFSTSIMTFWKRWHISLSTWFRDYLYLPLGGNRVSASMWVRNIVLVFLLSGFWHGANWTFIIWGAIHAGMYLLERFTPIKWARQVWWQKLAGWIFTYIGVNLAWVFFRANNFGHARQMLSQMFSSEGQMNLDPEVHLMPIFFIFLLVEWFSKNERIDDWFGRFHFSVRWVMYGLMLFCIWSFSGTTNHPFIYFQF